jgi:hypothetical protein
MSHFLQLCVFFVFPFINHIIFTQWLLKIERSQFSNTSTWSPYIGSLLSYNFSYVITVSKTRPTICVNYCILYPIQGCVLYLSSIAKKVRLVCNWCLTLFNSCVTLFYTIWYYKCDSDNEIQPLYCPIINFI